MPLLSRIHPSNPDDLPLPRWSPRIAYVAFWLAAGLFLGIAELQHYLRIGGQHPWEPFLWEMSSMASTGVLTLGIFAWHRRLFDTPRTVAARIGGHLAGALAYVVGHSALMHAMRAVVYATVDVRYHPGDVTAILGYEGAKDLVSYTLIVAISHGVLLLMRERRQRAAVSRLNAELAAARIARLQEQIQPHFLFNTLNLVSSVMYEDVERADRILSDLAELLRRSLDAGRQPTHSLREEMRLAEPFLSIMSQRFGGRLSSRIDMSKEALDTEVPSLVLMAPLENAVKHGVAQSGAPVDVRVGATVRDGMLELTVADSAGRMERDERPGGVGLANTRERLAAMYGDAASVSLTREDGHTVLRMRWPCVKASAGGHAT
jgi:two-component system LytT family sensor kinase